MRNQRANILIIAITVLSIASITFSNYNPSISSPVRNAFSFVLVPLQAKINSFGLYFVERSRYKGSLIEANQKIIELDKEIASLSEAINILKSKSYENDRLRELYQLSDEYPQYEKIACRVIARESQDWFQIFKIDKGSKDGIKLDMNVLSDRGLCGIVTYVGYNYSTVRSIIDDESRVSAMTQHSLESCIVEGDISLYSQNRIKITGLNLNSVIQEGDRIVTANISTKFLPNLLIGYATDIQVNDNQLSKSGYIIPVTNFSNLSEVLVIKRLKSDSLKD